jgi:hypothetical protein
MPRLQESSNGCSDADNEVKVDIEAKRRQNKENTVGQRGNRMSMSRHRRAQFELELKQVKKPNGNSLFGELTSEIPSDAVDINTADDCSSLHGANQWAVSSSQRAVNTSECLGQNYKGSQVSDQTLLYKNKSNSFPSGFVGTGTPVEFDVLEVILTPLSSGRHRDRHRLAFDKQSPVTISKPIRSIDFPGLDSPDTENVEIDIIERTFLDFEERDKTQKRKTKVAEINRRKVPSPSNGKMTKNGRCKETKVKKLATKSSTDLSTLVTCSSNDRALDASRHETDKIVTTKTVKQMKLDKKKLLKKRGKEVKKNSPCKLIKANMPMQTSGKKTSEEHVSKSSSNRMKVNKSATEKKRMLSSRKKSKSVKGKENGSRVNVKVSSMKSKVKVTRQQANVISPTVNDAEDAYKVGVTKDMDVETNKSKR